MTTDPKGQLIGVLRTPEGTRFEVRKPLQAGACGARFSQGSCAFYHTRCMKEDAKWAFNPVAICSHNHYFLKVTP